ncbi:MAG: hypothetical protein H7Z39_03915, partial [Burkholderiaceae bacterium]|nr:hypothetical protein [Burkholderiaceae bacterium]
MDAAAMTAAAQADGLPLRWAGLPRFVILDAGFGHGEHFLAAWRAWQSDPARPPRLHYLALCPAPLAPALLAAGPDRFAMPARRPENARRGRSRRRG